MHFIITPLWDLSKNVSQKIVWKRLATNTSSFQGQIFIDISRRRLSDCLTGSSVVSFLPIPPLPYPPPFFFFFF